MISYEQMINEQKNIEALCSPKTSTSIEIYGPNNNYGFSSILKQYSGYPKYSPIMAIIPHGIYLNERNIFPGELNTQLPAVLNYPAFRMAIWKKMSKKKKILASASPFLYALKLFKAEFPKSEKQGTLYFPPHSTAMVETGFDKESLIKQLIKLPDEFHPITICVHWYDVSLGLHKYFLSKGLKVVSAGHLKDENFVFRWLHLVSQFKYTMGSNLGGSLFYSVAAGVPHKLINAGVNHKPNKNFNQNNKVETKKSLDRHHKLWQLFLTPMSQINITSEQKELVNYCLGSSCIKQPKVLLKLLQNLE